MKVTQKQANNDSNRSATEATQNSWQNQSAQIANTRKDAVAQRAFIAGINDSPRMLTQRRQIESYISTGRQQAQERGRPTMQMKPGIQLNDNKGLEREADVMGNRAMSTTPASVLTPIRSISSSTSPIQRTTYQWNNGWTVIAVATSDTDSHPDPNTLFFSNLTAGDTYDRNTGQYQRATQPVGTDSAAAIGTGAAASTSSTLAMPAPLPMPVPVATASASSTLGPVNPWESPGGTVRASSPGGTVYRQGSPAGRYSSRTSKKSGQTKRISRREAAGYDNPSHSHGNMLPLWEEAAMSPLPPGSTAKRKKWLMKEERRFKAYSSDRKRSTEIKGHKEGVLGHAESAGSNFNREGHTRPRKENLEHNRQTSSYGQIEPRAWSDASGASEERYASPGPHLGSHPTYWNPSATGFGGGPWHTWHLDPAATAAGAGAGSIASTTSTPPSSMLSTLAHSATASGTLTPPTTASAAASTSAVPSMSAVADSPSAASGVTMADASTHISADSTAASDPESEMLAMGIDPYGSMSGRLTQEDIERLLKELSES